LYLALPVRPADKRGSGIGVAQIDEVRIRPDIGRRARAHSRREDFDQSLGFQAGRLYREYSREIRNRDDGRHADPQRQDAHKRKGSSFCQRARGMNQVIPDAVQHALDLSTDDFALKSNLYICLTLQCLGISVQLARSRYTGF